MKDEETNIRKYLLSLLTGVVVICCILFLIGFFNPKTNNEVPQMVIMEETKLIEILIRQYKFVETEGSIILSCNYDKFTDEVIERIDFQLDNCYDYQDSHDGIGVVRNYNNGEILVHLFKSYPRCRIFYNHGLVKNISKEIAKKYSNEGGVYCNILIRNFPKVNLKEHLGIGYKNESLNIAIGNLTLTASDKWILLRDENQSKTPRTNQLSKYAELNYPTNIEIHYEDDFYDIEEYIDDYFMELERAYKQIFDD